MAFKKFPRSIDAGDSFTDGSSLTSHSTSWEQQQGKYLSIKSGSSVRSSRRHRSGSPQRSVKSVKSHRSVKSNRSVKSSKQMKPDKKTTEVLSKHLDKVMLQEIKKHRAASVNSPRVRAPSPDTSEDSSNSSIDSEEESSEVANDNEDSGAFFGFKGKDDETIGSLECGSDDSNSSSEASGGMACSAKWMPKQMNMQMLRNCSPFDDLASEFTDSSDREHERPHDDKLQHIDIYAKTPSSWRVRIYSKMPRPDRSDHILVKVRASTVSMQDCLARASGNSEHRVPGRQVMGIVQSVGRKARKTHDIVKGDQIVALTPNGKGNARFISIPAKTAIFIPSDIQRDDVICLVESYMAAYQMLNLGKNNGLPHTDSKILIIGASDPVGQAMVEMAIKEGATVYATSAKSHRQHLLKMGAIWFPNNPIKLTKLRGKMDVVVDTLCLDGYKTSYEALKRSGRLVCTINPPNHYYDEDASLFQQMQRYWSTFNARYIWGTFNRNVSFYDVHKSFADDPKMFEHELRYLLCKLRNEEIKPKVSGRIALNQVPKAHTFVEKGLPNGTVVVLPWEKLDATQQIPMERQR